MIVFQIVGFSNSGKTTVTAELVKALTDRGLHTATVKHHGHEETLPAPDYNKDTWKHRQAGAESSLAVTETAFQLTASHSRLRPLEKWLEIYKLLEMDVVLIEGYKHANYPKVLLVREEDHFSSLYEKLTNIQAVLFACKNEMDISKTNFNGYLGSSFDIEGFIHWFIEEYTDKGD